MLNVHLKKHHEIKLIWDRERVRLFIFNYSKTGRMSSFFACERKST